jgi:GWxTD domain-containing protein
MPIRRLESAARRPQRLLAGALAALALAASFALPPATAAPQPAAGAELSAEHQAWLEQVAWIITKTERAAFLALEKDYQRDAFIERFWEVRDPFPDTARNEARDAWESRLVAAKQEFGSLEEDRARIFLLNGPPAARFSGQCAGMWPIEVWAYPPSERIPEVLALVFYQRFGQGKYWLWNPGDGVAALFQFAPARGNDGALLREIANSCPRSDQLAGAISSVLRKGQMAYSLLVSRAQRPIEAPSREWVATFNSYSTDLPADASELPATLAVSFPGRRQNRSILQGNLAVPATAVGTAELGGNRSYNFLLNGEILLGRKLFDAFRYKFDLPAGSVTSESIPLLFERFLRPGSYTLILKLEDLNGGGFYRAQAAIEVPQIDAEPLVTIDDETAKILAEANAALSTLDNTIRILQPRGEFQSGLMRFDTLTTGTAIAEVTFELDGRPILRKNRPPFSVELDLGEVPRTRNLRAVAYDASGAEVASDEALLNSSPHRFSVRLIEPRRGKSYERSLRAEVEVEVPEDAALERVEFYLNETLVASLYQPPFTLPIVLPPDGAVAYVRAVAYQTDGNSTEDLVFVNAPENLEELEIQFVELYTTVLDRQNRPVADLDREAFRIAEDGVPQSLTRFERVENLPIHVGCCSTSRRRWRPNCRPRATPRCASSAEAVTPKDRAALIPFNDRPTLSVRMTNRQEDLGAGLAGLKAERGTALYDSVVFSLFYFNGIKRPARAAAALRRQGREQPLPLRGHARLRASRRRLDLHHRPRHPALGSSRRAKC